MDYLAKFIDPSEQFIDEWTVRDPGVIKYQITIQKGSIGNGCTSFSLFDGITVVSESVRVGRVTDKAYLEFVSSVYNRADELIARMELLGNQWKKIEKIAGDVWYYCDKYTLYIKEGFAVECDKSGGEKVKRVSTLYRNYGMEGKCGSISDGYKYQEYNPINLADVLAKYQEKEIQELHDLADQAVKKDQEIKDQEIKQRGMEMEAQKKKESEAVASFQNKLSEYKQYLLLKYCYYDNSDIQTDYFSNELDHIEILGSFDQPIRSTFAGGRMDIWRLLRSVGQNVPGLKFKADHCYKQGVLMGLKDKSYTGSGSYNEVILIDKYKLSESDIKIIRGDK